MAAAFLGTSSQHMENAASPVTTYPFTVGMWLLTGATGGTQNTAFCVADTGATGNLFMIGRDGADLQMTATAAGTGTSNTLVNALTANVWVYVVGRFISATNRRLSCIRDDSAIVHNQSTTSRDPAGVDTMALGARRQSTIDRYWTGRVAELWVTNTDIQADGAELLNSTLWQLAFGGPFSMPHIAANMLDYRSLWMGPLDDEGEDVFVGQKGPQVWTNTNGVSLGAHPPLPYWYETPRSRASLVPI